MCQQHRARGSILYVAANTDAFADVKTYPIQLSPLVAAVSVSVVQLFSASVCQVHVPENVMSCLPSNSVYPEPASVKTSTGAEAAGRSGFSRRPPPPLSNIPARFFSGGLVQTTRAVL